MTFTHTCSIPVGFDDSDVASWATANGIKSYETHSVGSDEPGYIAFQSEEDARAFRIRYASRLVPFVHEWGAAGAVPGVPPFVGVPGKAGLVDFATAADPETTRLRQRLQKDRPRMTVGMQVPVDVVEELMEMAPRLGFSGYHPLIRAYIGRGLRADAAELARPKTVASPIDQAIDLIESLAYVQGEASLAYCQKCSGWQKHDDTCEVQVVLNELRKLKAP